MTDIADNECAQWCAHILGTDADTDAVVLWLTGIDALPHTLEPAADDRTRIAQTLLTSIDAQLRTARRLIVGTTTPPQPKPQPLALPSIQERMQARAAAATLYDAAFPSISSTSSSTTSSTTTSVRVRRIMPTAVVAPSSSSSSSSSSAGAGFQPVAVSEFIPMAETARSLFRDGNNNTATDVATPTVALPPPSTDDLDDAGPSRVLERTLSSSSVGSSAAGTGIAAGGESLAIAAATPPLDSAESALILRLARVFSCLLLFGVSHNVLHDCRAVVSVLRNTTPPLMRACASPPTDVDGLSTPLWTVALLRGGERCALFACATLNHARRLLFALNGSAQSSIGAIPALRRREPALCDALLRSAERAQRRAESITPLAATVSRAVPPQAAAHLSVDDANRNRFRATAEQATYNNRERQRDEFMQIQRAWLENAPANASADDKVQLELRQLAVDELTSSVRQFVARTDPLNLPWLGAMLREQLLAAAVADPLDEQDEAIKAMASAEKLRKLRGRIDGARGATGATTSSHGARKPNQRARMPAATAAVAAARRRSFAQLFVGASSSTRNSAAMSFVYEFAEAALHEGGHLHAALASVLVSGLRELLRTTGADGAATRHDLPALRAALARQTSQLCALARFLGFVQALPLFHVYPQTSDVPLDGGVDVVDAMAWPLRPAPFIEAAARNGALVLTLPWVCALLSAWHNERVLSESRIVQETIDALRAVAPCDVLRSRELSATVTLPRVFAVNTLASTFAAIGEVVDLPPLRALDGAKSLRVSLRVSGFVEADGGGAVSPEPQATPDSKAGGSELIAAPDDFEDLLDDDFVRLCFEPLDALAHAAAQLNDESGGVSRGSPSRPTKKITLTTAVAVRPRALSMAAPATTRLSPNEPDSGEQEQLRRWFAWQHPQLATLAETVSSNVARSALAFISEENAVLRSDIAAARARLLARIAIGDAVARVQFERLARETLVAVLPSEVEQLHARVAGWARTAITEFVDARVRAALPLLLPATLSDSVMRAAVAHTRSMALSQVLNSGAQRAAHIVVNTVSAELTKAARLCRRDTLSWSESAPTIEAAIQCLYAATMLFEPSDSACLQALQATTSTNPVLCERIRVLAHVADDSGGASASDTGGVVALRCVAAAIDALLLTLDAEPKLRDRGRWQPLLPRATLALGEAVAHALPRATGAQATALCALVRRACVKVAAFDVRLVRNVHYIVQDARHAAPHACVKQLLDDIEATTQKPQKE